MDNRRLMLLLVFSFSLIIFLVVVWGRWEREVMTPANRRSGGGSQDARRWISEGCSTHAEQYG